MKYALLFLLLCILGGVGGAAGSMLGNELGPGGVFLGGGIGGAGLVVAGAFLAVRLGWIQPQQRRWTIIGALLGFAAAVLVTLATLSSPVGAIASTMLVGIGGTLASRIGISAHVRLDD